MSNAIDVAKKYFKLSNEGNLDAVADMFTESSTYNSENTGAYLGKELIMGTMRPFFDKFETLRWDAETIQEIRPGVVQLDFIFQGKKKSGETVSWSGEEVITVANDKIQDIKVRNK